MRPIRRLILVLAATLVAGPALAYTIYLKDGSKILAKSKYEVRGNQAVITLPSGTKTAIAASEIDVAKTEELNKQDLGTAILIEDGKAQGMTTAPAPPPDSREKLSALIKSGAANVGASGPTAGATSAPAAAAPRPRGFDEQADARKSYAPLVDTSLAAAIKEYVGGRGLPVEVAQGTVARRPLLVYETESEGNVFRALLTSAAALIEMRTRYGGSVDGFQLLCETSDGSLAARFTLTPAQAADLLAGREEISRFFVDHVEF